MFESYEKFVGEQSDENDQEEFVFPFNEEEELDHTGIQGYSSNSLNMYSLKRREEPLIDDVSQGLHPTPPNMQVWNTPTLYEAQTKVAPSFKK